MRREKAGVWREVCVEGGSMEGGVRGGRCVEGDSVEGGVWRKINDYRCGGGGGERPPELSQYHTHHIKIVLHGQQIDLQYRTERTQVHT